MSRGTDSTTVLVVDDEEEVADVYALRLDSEYETQVAYGGQEGLDAIDDDVDVVLLDRRMPELSGDDVLDLIRERGHDCRVIVLTAVDPGFDIVDMPFDDYLCKPVEKSDLVTAIEQQRRVQQHDDRLAEYLEVRSKLSLLESELPPQGNSDELDSLRSRAKRLEDELDETLEEFDGFDEFEQSFASVSRHPS